MLVEELEARLQNVDLGDLAAHAEFLRGVSPFTCRLAEIWEDMIEVIKAGPVVRAEVVESSEEEESSEGPSEEPLEVVSAAEIEVLKKRLIVRESRRRKKPTPKNSVRKPYRYHCDNCGHEEAFGHMRMTCPKCSVSGKPWRRLRKKVAGGNS